MAQLSVIVPATDAPATLPRVLAAIRRADQPPEEVIVVDEPERAGPAEARNAGARRASGDVLVFVDSDVEVHDDAFARIRSAFGRADAPAALFGSYDDDPDAPGLVSSFRNLLHHHVHQQGAGDASTFWAGLGAVRADAFRAIGGFDAGRFPQASIEDIELGLRLRKSGRRIVLDPDLQGKHLKAWTFTGMTDTDLRRRAIPWLRLLLEEEESSAALNLGPRHRAAVAAAVVLAWSVACRRGRPATAALALLLALDGDFYALLLRRRGWRLALAGVPLHIAHRLTSAAAVPVALAAHLAASRSSRPQ